MSQPQGYKRRASASFDDNQDIKKVARLDLTNAQQSRQPLKLERQLPRDVEKSKVERENDTSQDSIEMQDEKTESALQAATLDVFDVQYSKPPLKLERELLVDVEKSNAGTDSTNEHSGEIQVEKDKRVLQPDVKQAALYDKFGLIHQPPVGAELDPPLLPAGQNIRTKGWNGNCNTHESYNSLSDKGREDRHRLIFSITLLWPGVPIQTWILPERRPSDLPENPYDYSNTLLEAIKWLAQLTKGEVGQARAFIYRAPE